MGVVSKCLISAGPTREGVDAVRILSNPSTGTMGYALASEAKKVGLEVTLVSGPVCLPPPPGVTLIKVESALEMREAVLEEFQNSELVIMSAAVSDHRPDFLSFEKLKKDKFPDQLKLIRNPDILAELGEIKLPSQTLVGFAAETEDHLLHARSKLITTNLDWIVLNDIGSPLTGFDSDTNEVTLLSRNEESVSLKISTKTEIASGILEIIWK